MKGVRLVSFVAAAIIVASCGSATTSGGNTNTYAGKVIKFGAILSITGAGGVYGPQSRDGMNLAVKQINAAGGVNGVMIQLTIHDDASDKAQASQLAQTLIQQEKDVALLGPPLSKSAVGAH